MTDSFISHHLSQEKRSGLMQRWNVLTAIPEAPLDASVAERERARQSRLTSSVLFFFTLMVVLLLPACAISPYPNIFWLDLGLASACILALALNRRGHTLAAGILVTLAGFTALTAALFSTVPFDETTLQGYDMYVIVELLAVALLPLRSVFLVLFASVFAILGTLFLMPHTTVLNQDLQTRLLIMLARPVGTLLLVAGVAYILSTTMQTAIQRAGRAELVAQLEHDLAEQKRELDVGTQQILHTHVAVANGNLAARAPLTQDHVLWQIAWALNNLLVRFQRAARAEAELKQLEQTVSYYVQHIVIAEQERQIPILPLLHTRIDPLIGALQGKKFGRAPLSQRHPVEQSLPENPQFPSRK